MKCFLFIFIWYKNCRKSMIQLQWHLYRKFVIFNKDKGWHFVWLLLLFSKIQYWRREIKCHRTFKNSKLIKFPILKTEKNPAFRTGNIPEGIESNWRDFKVTQLIIEKMRKNWQKWSKSEKYWPRCDQVQSPRSKWPYLRAIGGQKFKMIHNKQVCWRFFCPL